MKNSCRFLSFPGTAQMPACRVRRDSPHFWKFRKLANRIRDHIPDIEAAELRVARAEGAATLHARAGLVFGATYTSTILRRVVESMEGGGRPSFFGGEIETAMGPARGTMVVPSFWEMVVLMREDFTNSGFCDMVALEDGGVLVRTRKVPIAISVPAGCVLTEDRLARCFLPGPLPVKNLVMLSASGAAGLLAEIIRIEAGYETAREGGPFCGQKAAAARRAMARKFHYEVSISLSDAEEPIDSFRPQS